MKKSRHVKNNVYLCSRKKDLYDMKNSLRIFVMGMAMLTALTAVSCSKHESRDARPTPISMENTTWGYVISDIAVEGEDTIDYTVYNYVIFYPTQSGKFKSGLYSNSNPEYDTDTVIETRYTYTKPEGKIFYKVYNPQISDWQDDSVAFTVQGEILKLNMPGIGLADYKRM